MCVPGVSLSASHGWLNHEAPIVPLESLTTAVTIDGARASRRSSHVDDLAGDRDLLVAAELRDRDLGRRALVATRPVVSRSRTVSSPSARSSLRQGRADARQRLEPAIEPFGPGLRARGRPVTLDDASRNPHADLGHRRHRDRA